MGHADERTLVSLRRSALITRALGIDNPAFAGGPGRVAALIERFFLLAVAIEGLERRAATAREGRSARGSNFGRPIGTIGPRRRPGRPLQWKVTRMRRRGVP